MESEKIVKFGRLAYMKLFDSWDKPLSIQTNKYGLLDAHKLFWRFFWLS